MYKFIELGGKKQKIVSNALLPRLYRAHFGRDLMIDLKTLEANYKKSDGDSFDSSVFENISWLMLKQGGEAVGDTIEEWLETIDVMELYNCIGEVVQLLQASQKTTASPKKK